MQLTNEKIARVFAMYKDEPCIWRNNPCKILGFDFERYTALIIGTLSVNGLRYWQEMRDIQLLLTPLSAISDEHAIEAVTTCGIVLFGTSATDNRNRAKRMIEEMANVKQSIEYETYQYLISKGYAVPLWFGYNHPANGKTAIELNIAITK